MNPRFEIVRTDSGWHVRFKGGNGEIVMTSETYTRQETAQEAIDLLLDLTEHQVETFTVDERVMTL
jgi:uncharacterized protein YegP (UPF0339 family)